jgi:hypothetical protein
LSFSRAIRSVVIPAYPGRLHHIGGEHDSRPLAQLLPALLRIEPDRPPDER